MEYGDIPGIAAIVSNGKLVVSRHRYSPQPARRANILEKSRP
jgi:hypothetical protein